MVVDTFVDFLKKFSQQFPYYLDQVNGGNDKGKLVYKFCYPNYFVVMEKISDTITNENRSNIVDPFFASIRGNKFLVVLILDMTTFEQRDSIKTKYYSSTTIYSVGDEVIADSFNSSKEALENDDGNGIYAFLSMIPAYYFGFPFADVFKSGTPIVFRNWYVDGSLQTDGSCLDCEMYGQLVTYYDRTNLSEPLVVKLVKNTNGNHNIGIYKEFYSNGVPKIMGSYNFKGKMDGLWQYFDNNGKCIKEVEYDGLRTDRYL